MKTVVLGKNIENIYKVDSKQKTIIDKDGKEKVVYTDIPVITKESNIVGNPELCSFKGRPSYNRVPGYFYKLSSMEEINISEDETVSIEKEIFRADLNELHLFTDKIVKETDVDKELMEDIHESHMMAFNKQMIESNDKLFSYCKLHGLDVKKTDCIELFKLVYPGSEYMIVDGTLMEVLYDPNTFTGCGAISKWDYATSELATSIDCSLASFGTHIKNY